MHAEGLHAVPLQGAPGAPGGCRGLWGVQDLEGTKNAPAAYRQSLEPWARLKFHAGWSGWTRPLTMAGGAEAGCLGEYCRQSWETGRALFDSWSNLWGSRFWGVGV